MRLDRHRARIAAPVVACLLASGFLGLGQGSDNLANADGRWPAAVPASFSNGAAWKTGSLSERRAYVLGVTDGLRLAAVFERAGVDLGQSGSAYSR
jgi:hypothetical protein